MSSESVTLYTSAKDCVIWSGMLGGILLSGVVITAALNGEFSLSRIPQLSALGLVFALVLGLLLFGFGWLGRVTVSPEGIEAPRFSGSRDFLAWNAIRRAIPGSISGWPCTMIAGGSPEKILYIMLIGDAKRGFIGVLREYAGADHVLTEHLC
jgi:Predicted membrane protein|nr:hypothetical protein [uncultured Steroidobacter sp.]